MLANVLRLVLVVMFGLLVGTMFGILVGYNPASLSAGAYVEQHQNAVRALNTLLPAMGAACILVAFSLAVLSRREPRLCYLYVGAAILMLVAAITTRFGNQPINAIVMSWTPQTPAENWVQLRDQWWYWHVVRTTAGIGALVLVGLAVMSSAPHRAKPAA